MKAKKKSVGDNVCDSGLMCSTFSERCIISCEPSFIESSHAVKRENSVRVQVILSSEVSLSKELNPYQLIGPNSLAVSDLQPLFEESNHICFIL